MSISLISNKTEDNSNLLHDLSEQDGRFSSLLENKIPQSIMSGTPEVIQLFLKAIAQVLYKAKIPMLL